MASDTSLLFNILGRDNVSKVFREIRREAIATAGVMSTVGESTAGMARDNFTQIGALTKQFAIFGGVASGAALAAGGALAGLPLVFAGIGAKLLAENATVKNAF